MPRNLLLRRLAEIDISDAHNWYENQRAGLGLQFENSIISLFDNILHSPFAFHLIGNGVRKARARKFPYHVFYRIEGSVVVVIAVLHVSRDPDAWMKR